MSSKNTKKKVAKSTTIQRGASVRAAAQSAAARKAARAKAGKSGKSVETTSSSRAASSPAPDRRPLVEPAGPPPMLLAPELPERYNEDRVTVMARDP